MRINIGLNLRMKTTVLLKNVINSPFNPSLNSILRKSIFLYTFLSKQLVLLDV